MYNIYINGQYYLHVALFELVAILAQLLLWKGLQILDKNISNVPSLCLTPFTFIVSWFG